jgi:hypothetical protein
MMFLYICWSPDAQPQSSTGAVGNTTRRGSKGLSRSCRWRIFRFARVNLKIDPYRSPLGVSGLVRAGGARKFAQAFTPLAEGSHSAK